MSVPPEITITYCPECGLGPAAQELAELLEHRLAVPVRLQPGQGGIFEVAIDGQILASNFTGDGALPVPSAIVNALVAMNLPQRPDAPVSTPDELTLAAGAACPMPARPSAARSGRIRVYNPRGAAPPPPAVRMAERPGSLAGKPLFLIDVHFNDGDRLLRQMREWFARHLPHVHVIEVTKRGVYAEDDAELFGRIRDLGGVAVMAIGH